MYNNFFSYSESRNIKDTKKFIEDFILFDKDKKYNAAHYKRG